MKISFSRSRSLIICGILLLLILGCRRDKNKYSIVPFLHLDLTSVVNNGYNKDSFIAMNFSFTDGDGDIGLSEEDTAYPFAYGQPYFYNLKVWMLEKKNGVWRKLQDPLNPGDSLNFHERLLPITPTGRYKWVEGQLTLRVPAEYYTLKPDTVKIQVELIDRALHSSGVQETETWVLQH